MSNPFKPQHLVTAPGRSAAFNLLMAMVPMAEADRGQHVLDELPGPWTVRGRRYEGAWLAWPIDTGFEPATVLVACFGDCGPAIEAHTAIQ